MSGSLKSNQILRSYDFGLERDTRHSAAAVTVHYCLRWTLRSTGSAGTPPSAVVYTATNSILGQYTEGHAHGSRPAAIAGTGLYCKAPVLHCCVLCGQAGDPYSVCTWRRLPSGSGDTQHRCSSKTALEAEAKQQTALYNIGSRFVAAAMLWRSLAHCSHQLSAAAAPCRSHPGLPLHTSNNCHCNIVNFTIQTMACAAELTPLSCPCIPCTCAPAGTHSCCPASGPADVLCQRAAPPRGHAAQAPRPHGGCALQVRLSSLIPTAGIPYRHSYSAAQCAQPHS